MLYAQVIIQELHTRYQALLQMYGEKVEENDELRLDLEDVKMLLKQQVNAQFATFHSP